MSIHDETLILISQVPKELPKRNGKRLNLSTVYRWKQRGLDGVILETCYVGGQQFTSLEALRRFDEAVTAAKNGARITPMREATPAQRDRAHDRAKQKLLKMVKMA